MKRVLITEPIDEAGTALLDARDDVEWRVADAFDEATLTRQAVNADAIIVRVAQLPASVLRAAANLAVVSKHGVGCDNVDVDHLTSRGLPMAIAAGANAQSVAEHTMAMMLAAARRLREQDAAQRAGDFAARHRLIATDLSGAKGLVIGYGRIGRLVAPLMAAFGMAVTVADVRDYRDEAQASGFAFVTDFREALTDADFVTLHVPLDRSTALMLDRAAFARFKPGAIFINCARGGIMDEAALEWALARGPLAAAGLDVFTQEPTPTGHPLLARDDIVVSPHTGAAAFGSVRAMSTMAAQNVLDVFDARLREDCTFNLAALRAR